MKSYGRIISTVLTFTLLVLLAGCGGGGGGTSPSTVSGTASQGSALAAGTTVNLVDAKGVSKTTTVGSNGAYSIVVDGLTAPFVMNAGGFYSYASGSGTTNINPLTHLSMQLALGTSSISANSVIPANYQTTFTTVVTNLKTNLSALYPSTVSSTQTDFLNGNITIDSGVDRVFASATITPPDASGNFSITIGGQVIISGKTSSGSVTMTPNTSAITAANSALFPSTSISGKVTLNGSGLSGVTVTLDGSSSTTTTTASDGTFTFTGVQNGSYTVSAALTGYIMSSSQSVTISNANVSGVNFTATANSTTRLMGGAVQGKVPSLTGSVTTFAGVASVSGKTDGIGSAARFSNPYDITTDGTNLYVVDNNALIRKIVISTGAVTTLAGSSYGHADGTGSAASFYGPEFITTDGVNLYVADTGNNTIRKIVISSGVVTTLAGTAGTYGYVDGTGSAAQFNTPTGITTDGTNLYVCDRSNSVIRKIVISTGVVTTLAGNAGLSGYADGTGSIVRFDHPNGLTTDGTNLYVTDTNNSVIRKIVISSGVVTTLAGKAGYTGSADGAGSAARFTGPHGITTDGTNLYVVDINGETVRQVVISTGVVTTLVGSYNNSGYADGTGLAAKFAYPSSITTDGKNLYVADQSNDVIRKIQ